MAGNTFGTRASFEVGSQRLTMHRLDGLGGVGNVDRLPYCLKVLLENLLRKEDGVSVTPADIQALARWDGGASVREIAFSPARVLMQDFTGVPAVADLAAMRDAMAAWGSDPAKINPLVPAELVVDHSVVVDRFGTPDAFDYNVAREFERNVERYRFLRWGQGSFENFSVVPPGTGICHQVNIEHLARVVFVDGDSMAYPDTVVGTDSHTPMVNGIGVVGWGVGGIEAEAAMLGQPISMLVPKVVGLELTGSLPEGATSTDLVLTIAELLRRHGVVGAFVEVHGPGLATVPAESRATIGNMSPEYGSTITIFPVDGETLRYLRMTGRTEDHVSLVESYSKEQGLWHDPEVASRASGGATVYSENVTLDLSTVVPSLAGPSRPQDRVPLSRSRALFADALVASLPEGAAGGHGSSAAGRTGPPGVPEETATGEGMPGDPPAYRSATAVTVVPPHGESFEIDHGHVVIAAITSCTNTSNPSVMLAAGLLARNAVEAGLRPKPWVKTSLAPGSKVVMEYFERAGVLPFLEKLGFGLVGFGCTTCIGNSGPLSPEISDAINGNDLAAVAVLSGNRNFEGRINPDVRMNYLASPPLVVAYALAGTMDIDLTTEPLGIGADGRQVYLRDVWPTSSQVSELIAGSIDPDMFRKGYEDVFTGDERWNSLEVPRTELYTWDPSSTYVHRPPFFEGLGVEPDGLVDIEGARVLAVLGDSVTTDHISPAGSIRSDSPAGHWLIDRGVTPDFFSSYGARRGNHEVMIRGTLANTRIRNALAPGTEGGFTAHLPDGEVVTIYDAACAYRDEGVPLVILAGKEYGSGSSRDWAAKGVALLGVRAVIAESFERIHRSNLIGMGVLPLQFRAGSSVAEAGLTGRETFTVRGLAGWEPEMPLQDRISVEADGREVPVTVRIDTPKEAEYFRHGGILQYVLRNLR